MKATFGSPSSELPSEGIHFRWPLAAGAKDQPGQRLDPEGEGEGAEVESLAIQRQQVTPELIRLREMENQRLAIEKWDGKLPNVSGGAVPFINVK